MHMQVYTYTHACIVHVYTCTTHTCAWRHTCMHISLCIHSHTHTHTRFKGSTKSSTTQLSHICLTEVYGNSDTWVTISVLMITQLELDDSIYLSKCLTWLSLVLKTAFSYGTKSPFLFFFIANYIYLRGHGGWNLRNVFINYSILFFLKDLLRTVF